MLSFLTAETIPAPTPIVSAMTMAMDASVSVTGSFLTMSERTGSLSRIDSPRSPDSAAFTQ